MFLIRFFTYIIWIICCGCYGAYAQSTHQLPKKTTLNPIKSTTAHSYQHRKLVPKHKIVPPVKKAPSFLSQLLFKSCNKLFNRNKKSHSYAVHGKRYQVLTTATGYKTQGFASWYGSAFHRQQTSSGENYNMYAMTAAHRTLPLSTYLRVKNLDNGHEALVKVNDRGPFHDNRIIDLSYAAAHKIGLLTQGTAMVEIKAVKPTEKELLSIKALSTQYYLETGTFKTTDKAMRLKEKLMTFTAAPVMIEKYHQYYRVKIGPITGNTPSKRLINKFAQQGIKTSLS